MSILNIFKKKPKSEDFRRTEKKKKMTAVEAPERKIDLIKKTGRTLDERKPAGIKAASCSLLKKPYLSEKSTSLRKFNNKYIFEVNSSINKNEIKKLIEDIYNVKVVKINVINPSAKFKRWRQKKSYFNKNKKVIITLKKNQTIELGI